MPDKAATDFLAAVPAQVQPPMSEFQANVFHMLRSVFGWPQIGVILADLEDGWRSFPAGLSWAHIDAFVFQEGYARTVARLLLVLQSSQNGRKYQIDSVRVQISLATIEPNNLRSQYQAIQDLRASIQ